MAATSTTPCMHLAKHVLEHDDPSPSIYFPPQMSETKDAATHKVQEAVTGDKPEDKVCNTAEETSKYWFMRLRRLKP